MAGRAKVLLNHFWRPDDPVAVEEALLRDWVEVIKDFRTDEVNAACRAYLAHPERTESGRPIRPGPWTIVAIIERNRPRPKPRREPRIEAARDDNVTPQRAKEIIAEIYGGDVRAET